MGDQPVYLHTGQDKHRINTHRHPYVRFEPTTSVFEEAKTVHALDLAAAVIRCMDKT
jgi:hypothetical protein